MTATLILDNNDTALDVNDLTSGSGYETITADDWSDPPSGVATQPYLAKHGGSLVAGSDFYQTINRKCSILVRGSDRADLYSKISALSQVTTKRNYVIKFIHDGATNSNYADVLYSNMRWLDDDPVSLGTANAVLVEVSFICQPFWYGDEQTIATQIFTSTPAKLALGTILGDVETPAFMQITGQGTDTFGANINIGHRSNPMDNTAFQPIKDFGGAALTGCYGGEYLRYTPSNGSWDPLTSVVSTNINGIAMLSSISGVVVGDGGMIYTTGDTWANTTLRTSGTTQDLNAVVWAGGTTYFACGNGGAILKSTDSGATWSTLTSGSTDNLSCMSFVSTTVGWVGTAIGTALKTADGSTWASQSVGGASPVTSISAVSTTVVYAMSSVGLYKTTDGSTWARVGVSGFGDNTGMHFLSATHGWISSGSAHYVYYTTDSGVTWNAGINSSIEMYAVRMQSTSIGWAVAAGGVIYKTTDGGVTWATQTSPTTSNLKALAVVDANNVCAAGAGFTAISTANAGTTWTSRQGGVSWALSSSTDYKGRYRVWIRVKSAQITPANCQVRVSSAWAGGSAVANDAVNLAASSNFQWVDLGVVQIPCTPLSSQLIASTIPYVKLEVKGSEASKSFDVDVAYLAPVDGSGLSTSAALTAASILTIDTDEETVNQGSTNVTWTGNGPMLHAGTDNNITIAETAAGDTTGANGCTVLIKYKPRYLSPVA